MIYRLLWSVVFLGLWSPWVVGFSVQYGQPSQCDDFQVSWKGGQAPFSLALIPLYGTPRNISIPSSSYSGSSGSYSMPLPFAENSQMMALMYDATGVPSGALSQVMTVGKTSGGQSCNTTDPHPYFFYSWPDGQSPVQCSPFQFFDYPNASLPVTLTILAAGEDPQFVQPDASATNFTWTVNMPAGTSVVFMMTDAQDHQGGASGLQIIQPSSDFSCVVYPSDSSSSTSSATSPHSPANTGDVSIDEQSRLPVGTMAGIAVGGAVCALLAAGVAFCICRRRRRRQRKRRSEGADVFDLKDQPMTNMGFHSPKDYQRIEPFTQLPTSESYSASPDFNPYAQSGSPLPTKNREYPPSHSSPTPTLSSSSRRGESSSSNPGSARVVVHQDYADVLPPEEEELVELPPAYRDDRRPIPGLQPQPGASTRPAGKRR
ncbi:hypothetical protein OE88DRAFT_1656834 [Heliocybe sulcata]|uniref:Uncharacterized protein n=1 Tax=Heliocybe sulcata TaxID=5364 RepID=A0A5C3N7K0_9AGAM|nr:hypothetical protein OE88DRAFT_1656834 [Heliocybe sulcata]